MKNALTLTALAFGLMHSGAALAETAKPTKHAKIDRMTTQSIKTADDNLKCGKGYANFKILKTCGDASQYPVNALSGMNLN